MQIESLRKKYDALMLHPKKSGEKPRTHILENELIDCFGSMSNVNAKNVYSTRRVKLSGPMAMAAKEAEAAGGDNPDDTTDTSTDDKDKADKKARKNAGTNKYLLKSSINKQ